MYGLMRGCWKQDRTALSLRQHSTLPFRKKEVCVQMQEKKGTTLIEAIIGFAGLGILLLMVYTILLGGMQNWNTMIPQINARAVAREILYGKTGEEWGGLLREIKECNIKIRAASPTVGVPQTITTSLTALNFLTYYATGTSVGIFAICYDWQGIKPADEGYYLDKSVSYLGTLSKTIWRLEGEGTSTYWGTPTSKVLVANIRMGSQTYRFGDAYPLFRYYTGLGIEIFDDPTTTPKNELLDSIAAIRQIGINMVFDIDNDRDGSFGEDPHGEGNSDNDRKVDEDRTVDFSINTRAACMNLGRYTTENIP